ncbi:MAG: phospholipase D family protein, partial [Solirubrobacterales bacterium]
MTEGRRGFVKFFGQGSNRSPRDRSVFDAVKTSGSHRICTYPKERRPRAVRDGDAMFMGQLVSGPNDIVVYGRAIARAYVEGRDDASAEDVARRPWLTRWPHFIRVHSAEFLDGTLGDGVSLGELMDELGAYAFGPTAENADGGEGNVDPRMSIRQAAVIRLTEAGLSWLDEELERAFEQCGKLPGRQLA